MIISFMHLSPDGFVAGLNGEMNWIKVDEEVFFKNLHIVLSIAKQTTL